jgi:hypothetical protein
MPANLTPEGAVADQEGSATTSTFVHAHSPIIKLTSAFVSANHHVMLVDANPIRQVGAVSHIGYIFDTDTWQIRSGYVSMKYPK